MSGKPHDNYDKNVFINCPFDKKYQDLFDALVFAINACGYIPHCAKEINNSINVRIYKIMDLIERCRWGIHDISRTDVNTEGLPRFNMPLELGIFLGSQRFGGKVHNSKSCLILDKSPYRYQKFISDISGQDITCHEDSIEKTISAVRDWLPPVDRQKPHPGGKNILLRFDEFKSDLPGICKTLDLEPNELQFREYSDAALTWLAKRI